MVSVSSFFKLENDVCYQIGMDKGVEKGKVIGVKEGKVIGVKEGIEEGTRQTAINMKNLGLDLSLIAQVSNLSIEEIEQL